MAIKDKRIKEREVKKVIALLVGIALLSGVSGAWAQQAPNSGVVATATATGLDGRPIQAIEFAFTDTWRQNRFYSVTQTLTSDQLRFPNKPWNAKTNPYEVKAVTIATSNMSGNGLGRDAAVGFIGNLPNAGGLIGGAALLRPSSTNVNNSNNGGGASFSNTNTNKLKQNQGQGQNQNQAQVQSQNQTALGGAGGAGGSATINAPGGIGNTITNDANGNGTIIGGNIF